MKRIVLSIILVLVWMGFIFYLSSRDTTSSNSDSESIVKSVIKTVDSVSGANSDTVKKHQTNTFIKDLNNIFRKVCHAICYMALAILVFNMLIRLSHKKLWFYDIITFLICLIYAGLDEYHQTFVIGRTGQVSDVLIDSTGALVGIILISIIYKVAKRKVGNA